jgi:hypothetical protein
MRNDRRRPLLPSLLAVGLLFGLTACSGTRLNNVWRDPDYKAAPFHQVAVFVLGADPAVQQLAEDEVVRRLPMKTRGISGTGMMPDAERGDLNKARERLRAGGFDGVMIAHLVGVEGPQPWAQGSLQQVPISYRTMSNYYVTASEEAEKSSLLQRPTIVRVQLNLYALQSEALVWSASSQTFNPQATRDVAGDVGKIAVEELQKAGILESE